MTTTVPDSTMDALTAAARNARAARGAPTDDPWAVEPDVPADPEADTPPPDDAEPQRGGQRRPQQQRGERPTHARQPYKLRTRKAVAGMDWPYVLLAGGEFSGKSYELAKLAGSGRFCRAWRIAIGENPEEYHEIADWDIVEHDGSVYEITSALQQIDAAVRVQPMIDGKPHLVVFDSGSQFWTMLSKIAEARSFKSDEAREALLRNPNATVRVEQQYWNAVNSMWQTVENLLRRMPAVCVMTARAKEVVQVINGRPDNDRPKKFKPAIQVEGPYATTLYVRLDREAVPQVMGARMTKGGIRPGIDDPITFDGRPHNGRPALSPELFSLEHLIFNVMKFDPANARPSTLVTPNTADPAEQQVAVPRPAPAGASEVAGQPVERGPVAPGPQRGQ
jgi:hypothetical protein